jgi:hypothetical protein
MNINHINFDMQISLKDQEFVVATKYRLGIPIYECEGPCPSCLCPNDVFGDHA